jgi:hypothetical protein
MNATWSPIEGSHLGWAGCATCDGGLLCVPEWAGRARCSTCAAPTVSPGAIGSPGPVVGYSIGRMPRPAAVESGVEPVPPPLIPARLTQSLDEIASGRGQAMSLGAFAAKLGWTVTPWYWMAHDSTETSALLLSRGEMRAAAYWERPLGETWKTAGATVVTPRLMSIGVTALRTAIEEMGDGS